MPLRKLWNTICGKRSEAIAAPSTAEEVSESPQAERFPTKKRSQKSAGPAKLAISETTREKPLVEPTAQSQKTESQKIKSQRTAKKKPTTKLASLSREDKKLLGRIASLNAGSVLEVSVGDGLRALHVAQSLAQAAAQSDSPQPIYLAIDEFEMGGSTLTLRSFHQRLREHAVKAQLVPLSIDAGLDRVVCTYGQVDAVIWAADSPPTESQQSYLSRICKPETVVFSLDQGRWTENRHATATNLRRAA